MVSKPQSSIPKGKKQEQDTTSIDFCKRQESYIQRNRKKKLTIRLSPQVEYSTKNVLHTAITAISSDNKNIMTGLCKETDVCAIMILTNISTAVAPRAAEPRNRGIIEQNACQSREIEDTNVESESLPAYQSMQPRFIPLCKRMLRLLTHSRTPDRGVNSDAWF